MTPARDPIAASAARADAPMLLTDPRAGQPCSPAKSGAGMDADRRVQVGVRSTEHRRLKSPRRDPDRVHMTRIDPPARDHPPASSPRSRPRPHDRDPPPQDPKAPSSSRHWPGPPRRRSDTRPQTHASPRSGRSRSQPLPRWPSSCSHVAPPPAASPDLSDGSRWVIHHVPIRVATKPQPVKPIPVPLRAPGEGVANDRGQHRTTSRQRDHNGASSHRLRYRTPPRAPSLRGDAILDSTLFLAHMCPAVGIAALCSVTRPREPALYRRAVGRAVAGEGELP